jgi:hemerythrin
VHWDETLETGDELVDEQHRDIYRLISYAETAEDRPETIMRALDLLMDHVACHFATEEDLMERSGYGGTDAEEHRAEHRRLTEEARAAVLSFRTRELTSIDQVAAFLRSWLLDHIERQDRAFVDFVRSEGLVARLPETWAGNPPPSLPHGSR